MIYSSVSGVCAARFPPPDRRRRIYGGNTSCIELRLGNEVLILDAGSGIRRLRVAAGQRPSEAAAADDLAHLTHPLGPYPGTAFFRPAYDRASQISDSRRRPGRASASRPHSLGKWIRSSSRFRWNACAEFPGSMSSPPNHQLRKFSGSNHRPESSGGCTGFRITAGGQIDCLSARSRITAELRPNRPIRPSSRKPGMRKRSCSNFSRAATF